MTPTDTLIGVLTAVAIATVIASVVAGKQARRRSRPDTPSAGSAPSSDERVNVNKR